MEKGPGEINKDTKLKIKTATLIFTNHVVERFHERWKPFDEFDWVPSSKKEWKEKLEEIIRNSDEITLKKVKRSRD